MGHGVWERAVRCIKAKHLPGTTISDQVPGRHESQPLSRRPERGRRGGGEGGEGGVLLPCCHSSQGPASKVSSFLTWQFLA